MNVFLVLKNNQTNASRFLCLSAEINNVAPEGGANTYSSIFWLHKWEIGLQLKKIFKKKFFLSEFL